MEPGRRQAVDIGLNTFVLESTAFSRVASDRVVCKIPASFRIVTSCLFASPPFFLWHFLPDSIFFLLFSYYQGIREREKWCVLGIKKPPLSPTPAADHAGQNAELLRPSLRSLQPTCLFFTKKEAQSKGKRIAHVPNNQIE